MATQSVPLMNGGFGKTSYANNSLLQKTVIQKARPIVEGAIKGLYRTTTTTFSFPSNSCIRIADLGCSSGPNTLLFVSEILDVIHELCPQSAPELEVFLNDLPGNDFNSVFKSLPDFYEKLAEKAKAAGDINGEYSSGRVFISAAAGSFYGRLFPSSSLHFVHSSYSLHWLSKVPEGLTNNKGNIYMGRTSPPNVFKVYLEQFEKDFSLFLRLRSKEVVGGGGMVLTLIGRSTEDPTTNDACRLWELLAESLLDLTNEGLVEEGMVDSFNIPYYTPYKGEVKSIMEEEGSFHLDKMETFEVIWDPNDDVEEEDPKSLVFAPFRSGLNVASSIRAVTEPMLAARFGDAIVDRLFTTFAERIAHHLSLERTKYTNVVVSLIRKENI